MHTELFVYLPRITVANPARGQLKSEIKVGTIRSRRLRVLNLHEKNARARISGRAV